MRKGIIFFILLLIPLNADGYWVKTHRKITEHAITASNIKQYLFNNLGISLEKNVFNEKFAWLWMQDGSEWEDDGTRWRSHFYDPTTGAGLSIGETSLRWGKDYDVNEWSWVKARNYYYTALTQGDMTVRERNFAYLFRALGQIVHLVHECALGSIIKKNN